MRLLATTAMTLGLVSGHALAASDAEEVSTFTYGKRLYCSGEWVVSNALEMKVDLDAGDISSVETSGVVCQFIFTSTLEFNESFAFGVSGRYKVIFHEFFDEHQTKWYRWQYRDK